LPGHVAVTPLQVSATSHAPVAARHTAPTGAMPVGRHTGAPATHEVRPALHSPGTTQLTPATHVSQTPVLLHARPVPHAVPGGRSSVPMQTPAPPALQSSVPDVHGLPVSHEAPAMHSLHAPVPPQTPERPHTVPGGTSSVAMHTGSPEPQSKRPLEHGLLVSHDAPSVHIEHEPPPLHESPLPQPTPGGKSSTASHEATPVEQSVAPLVHGLPVSQTAPGTHSLHSPPLPQTPVTPHIVAGGALEKSGMQIAAPEPQSMRPSAHGLPVSQTAPATHG